MAPRIPPVFPASPFFGDRPRLEPAAALWLNPRFRVELEDGCDWRVLGEQDEPSEQ